VGSEAALGACKVSKYLGMYPYGSRHEFSKHWALYSSFLTILLLYLSVYWLMTLPGPVNSLYEYLARFEFLFMDLTLVFSLKVSVGAAKPLRRVWSLFRKVLTNYVHTHSKLIKIKVLLS
jgi:hypothetical protein